MKYGESAFDILYLLFAADTVITVLSVLKLNRRLEEMERIQQSMRGLSDWMSQAIGGQTVKTMESIEKGKRNLLNDAAQKRAALEKRQDELYQSLMKGRALGIARILKGVPELQHMRFTTALKSIQNHLKKQDNQD